jgi:hypothetical protein
MLTVPDSSSNVNMEQRSASTIDRHACNTAPVRELSFSISPIISIVISTSLPPLCSRAADRIDGRRVMPDMVAAAVASPSPSPPSARALPSASAGAAEDEADPAFRVVHNLATSAFERQSKPLHACRRDASVSGTTSSSTREVIERCQRLAARSNS